MTTAPADWWTFHGDVGRTGYTDASDIDSRNVGKLVAHTLEVGGPILSVPAIAGGFVYVGTANGTLKDGKPSSDGGNLHKIELSTGDIKETFSWPTSTSEGDSHGFTGMGCTPAVLDGKVYFSAFNGRLYCLNAEDLSFVWSVNLREADPEKAQPVTQSGSPQPVGWCSPLVVNGKVYVGMGEGENPHLYAFVYCLDAETGRVLWIFCTCQFVEGEDNRPNVLPSSVVEGDLPPGFTATDTKPVVKGCTVWTAISYDEGLNRLFCATGNPQPDSTLPAKGYSYGILALDADSGAVEGFVQAPPESSYRASDLDVDFGTSPTIFTREDGKRVIAIGCKNGGVFIIDAETLEILRMGQLLPYYRSGLQVPSVDPHGDDVASNPNPIICNEASNSHLAENFHGTYSTAAIDPATKRIFIGTGGNNYHFVAAGIDTETTPFMRALDWTTLEDVWEMDDDDPPKYIHPSPPMYETQGEAGLSSPAVVNDVVFCSTSKISIYAFSVATGKLLWSDDLGMQTGGFNGGYGYCLGMAVSGNYVVAGGLVLGRDGGILRIYRLNG